MNALTRLHPEDTAIAFDGDRQKISLDSNPDTMAGIELVKNDNGLVTYLSESETKQFAVFSEIFYDRGWKARLDQREEALIRTNYVVSGMPLPRGRHAFP